MKIDLDDLEAAEALQTAATIEGSTSVEIGAESIEPVALVDDIFLTAPAPAETPTTYRDDAEISRLRFAISERDARIADMSRQLAAAMNDIARLKPLAARISDPQISALVARLAAGKESVVLVSRNIPRETRAALQRTANEAAALISQIKTHTPMIEFKVTDISTMKPTPPVSSAKPSLLKKLFG